MPNLKYVISDIGTGWVGIVASETGLVRLTLPQPSAGLATRLVEGYSAVPAGGRLDGLLQRLCQYFRGEPVSFPDELDLSSATGFQRRVWAATRGIPYGETRSYRWVAERVGVPGAARAVGQAMGRNPLPIIIPCHRVVTTTGAVGGFSGGVLLKQRLLRLEGRPEDG